jgi:DNA-binding NarL/FixJ family response regulator
MISVFICDDQPIYLAALKSFFKIQGNIKVVGEAGNGQDAFKVISDTKPDVCIIDLSMPKMDGVNLIQNLHKHQISSKKIVLSQNSGKEWLDRLISNEIDGFILKTDNKEHLLNAVITVPEGDKYFSPTVATIFYRLLSKNSEAPAADGPSPLSPREQEVAILTSKGCTVKEIAQLLNCSENTIKTHKASLMRKTNSRNSAEVTAWILSRAK